MNFNKPLFIVSALSMAVLSACTSTTPVKPPIQVVGANTPTPKPMIVQTPVIQPQIKPPVQIQQVKPPVQIQQAQQHYASFDEWKQDFIARTINQGYQADQVYALMNGVSLNQRVIDLDRSQAEFTKMPWEYVNAATSTGRIKQGRAKIAQYPITFNNAESNYGVPKEIVAAIWGMESSFGAGMGNMDLVNALSTLAYDGRRREFAESQLIAMLVMVNRGDANIPQLKGSWAGGMGHTQFIPSTWIKEGVDGNQDGQISPWGIGDSLNSTASYLKNSGWISGLMPYYEVSIPSGFNHQLLDTKQSLDAWRQAGLISMTDEYLGGQAMAELWLPAGIHGPALLLTQNFNVIRIYNNSSSYALAVSLLARRIGGGSGLVASWPTHEEPLSRTQIQALQRTLTAQGFDTGGVDGVAGANTRRAFARWQAANGQIPDGFISQDSAYSLIW
ncbi:lytic murein transglycosylase [Moraxella sp. ZY200743]|uniref:lytic murein transglycosylase n=1 Tax=Moraxella sp. ZY200743 TaxID=2911970 RepID=UPI003D7E5394